MRRIVGLGFVAGTLLSPLPVFGPWMLPVGLAILSVDNPRIRRHRRRMTVRIGRRWPKLAQRLAPPPAAASKP